MISSHVIYEKQGHVAYITLNRPEALNALNLAMHAQLCDVWADFEADNNIWVGVLGATGTRSFSVGQDLKELIARTEAGEVPTSFGSRGLAGWPRLTERFDLTKPIIAKISGYALGGGFELALACDILIASENAKFGLPEARVGLIPGAGGIFRLMRAIPEKIATGYLMSGRHMSANRAFELGLINDVVPAVELDTCVQTWVDDLLKCSPLSLRTIKEVKARSATLDLESAFATEYKWDKIRRLGSDCIEGPRAFIDKRAAKWKGI